MLAAAVLNRTYLRVVEAFKANLPNALAGLNRESVTSLHRVLVQASRLPSQTSLTNETALAITNASANQDPNRSSPPPSTGIYFARSPHSSRHPSFTEREN
ncbi:unnamed protein product [Rodentolepis nana]|uniref:Uncharacterized protein n=1 Tax=Rodentolepis nana TaxID=102285 RepID=A0A0R3TT33_RODNA|nr:unnamed protein product [Rodentolepis nana]